MRAHHMEKQLMRFFKKIKSNKKVGIFILAFLFVVKVNAQQYSIKNYSVTDGLPQSQVFGLYQDNEGYIWMGTKGGGISRFDGKNFSPLSNDPSLGFINEIAHNRSKVFIAHTNGYSIYDKKTGEISHPINAINTINEAVSVVYPIGEDSLVVCTIKGVYIGAIDNPKKVSYKYRDNDDIPNCAIQQGNTILLGNNYGALQFLPRENTYVVTQLGRSSGLRTTTIRSFIYFNNKLLAGTYGGGLYAFENGRFSRYDVPGISNEQIIQCLLTDSKNNLWVGTLDKGVFIYNPVTGTTDQVSETEGLCRNNIVAMLEDDWGNLWLGSSGGGISKYNGQLFLHYTNRTGLPGKNVYACLQSPDSSIWLGTSAPGITRIRNGEITQFDDKTGFTAAKVKTLYYAANHNLLFIGTEGDGVWTYDGTNFDKPNNLNEHTGKWIKHIIQDEQNRLFVSTASKGVICFNEQLRLGYVLNKSNHLPVNRINQCLPYKNTLWVATEGSGLVCYNESKSTAYTLTTKEDLPGNVVRSVSLDDFNRVWVATPSGIGYIAAGAFSKCMPVRLPDGYNNIYLMHNHESSLFLGTAQGLVKLVYAKDLKDFKTILYTVNEGFTGIECSLNAVGKGNNHSLLIGTINGLTIYQPEFEKFNNIPPKLNFVRINLFYEDILAGKSLQNHPVFDYHQNHLGFKFNGIDQLNPDGVKYQWKLEGLETSWSPVTTTNEVNYTNLSPGQYTFKVKASNANGLWTSAPLTFGFEITKPWYNKTWFYVLIALTVVALMVFILLMMNLRNRRKQQQYRDKFEMEMRLLELQQMALRLQMNPHFIFNCLNSIQNLVSQNRNDDANVYIQKFSGLMRGMVDLTPKESIRLDQEIKLLSNYLELEKLNRSNSFDYEIITELEDQPDFYRIPPLLLQPFAENAIVHGFKGIDYTGNITVRISENEQQLIISITDNGKGVDTMLELPEERNSAIKITTERLNLYNKKRGNWIEIERNRKDSNGLVVTLTLISE